MALVVLGWNQWSAHRPPQGLQDIRLVGERAPASIRFVVIVDESGSFTDYEQLRQQVLGQLATWAVNNLRADDELMVQGFAGSSYVKLPLTTIGHLRSGMPLLVTDNAIADGTEIVPALTTATHALNGAPTRPTALIVLTDTLVSDANPTIINEAGAKLGVTSMSLILPKGMPVGGAWASAFSYEQTYEASPEDVDQTALAVGYAIAQATRQTAEKK